MLARPWTCTSAIRPYSRNPQPSALAFWTFSRSRVCPPILRSSGVASISVFADKGTKYTLETCDVEQVSDLLKHHKLSKWGFVVYRCTYDDDDAWARFMQYLNGRRDYLVRSEYEEPDLADRIDWTVQQNPEILNAATKDEVRRHFRQLVTSTLMPQESSAETARQAAHYENPRWNFCLHVDADALKSVTEGKVTKRGKNAGYVNLIRADKSWDCPDFDRFDWASYNPEPESDAEEDMYDEREEEIEGSRRADVGWMKVGIDYVFPELYATLMKQEMWDVFYMRPPGIQTV